MTSANDDLLIKQFMDKTLKFSELKTEINEIKRMMENHYSGDGTNVGMSRGEQIAKAGEIGIGVHDSSDEASARVKGLMRKKTSADRATDYKRMDKDIIENMDKEYEKSKARLKELETKDSDAVFGDGEELSEDEQMEMSILLTQLKHAVLNDSIDDIDDLIKRIGDRQVYIKDSIIDTFNNASMMLVF